MMIKYSESEPLDVLPSPVRYDNDEIAISYAIKMGTAKLIAYAAKTRLYADIDSLDEEILDLLALELQTQYYDSTFSLETKRELIKNTLLWYMKAGTVAAVEELVATVFGVATVSEWYEYGDDAYYFKVSTSSSEDEDTLVDELEALLKNVKNARSHLRQVDFETTFETELTLGAGYICAVTLDVGSASGDTIYIIIIDNEQIMSTAVWAEDADSDGLYDTLASYSAISGSYSDGNLVLEIPDDAAFCIY